MSQAKGSWMRMAVLAGALAVSSGGSKQSQHVARMERSAIRDQTIR
ncbi:hypothetical protein IVB22_18580 [Bradyrhizobium sp. 190]|nr:hypothetical protein [Bradyrhizobium sp. 190]MCK1514537.1 hypothetical protein [Bradyrhizobium sp. 190]